jgi:DNA repair protein RecO (recombination protein O)
MIKRKDVLILKSYSYGNSSKIIHVLTEDSERISLMAKGARRTKSRFGGNIEPLNLSQIVYYIKNEQKMGLLKEAAIKESYLSIKKDLYKLNIAWGILWIANKIPDPQDGLFGLESRTLAFLNRNFREEVLIYFLLSLFHLSGVPPKLNKCVKCDSREVYLFDVTLGGAVCENCKLETSYRLNNFLNLLYELKKGRLRVWEEIVDTERKKILKILFEYGVYHLGEWLNRLIDILPFEITPKDL